ncbi:MAG TPA: superoxide dismutase family protein [Longimicrobiaceae bacterium]|nr:superoxide dismutase family protein [Longimicrobiaceae bacterium]
MISRILISLPASALLLSGCTAGLTSPATSGQEASPTAFVSAPGAATAERSAAQAEVRLHNPAGEVVGTARLVEDAAGRVHLSVHVEGLAPGLHGMHLHAVGRCDGSTTPAFASAGGHFNPTGAEHGHHNPAGHHAGDLPNLVVNPAGVGRLSTTLEQFAIADLFDADGTALVIHQNEDDLRTNTGPLGPGNSGPRIACGVVSRR